MFAAWSRCAAASSQPPTPARCCSTDTGPQRDHHSGDDGRHLQRAADHGDVAVQAVLELGPGGRLIGQLLGQLKGICEGQPHGQRRQDHGDDPCPARPDPHHWPLPRPSGSDL
jgi:hypothetical protein